MTEKKSEKRLVTHFGADRRVSPAMIVKDSKTGEEIILSISDGSTLFIDHINELHEKIEALENQHAEDYALLCDRVKLLEQEDTTPQQRAMQAYVDKHGARPGGIIRADKDGYPIEPEQEEDILNWDVEIETVPRPTRTIQAEIIRDKQEETT